MLHVQATGAALDELDPESIQTSEGGVGRCNEEHVSSPVHVGDEPAVFHRDLDDPRDGSPERLLLLIRADILREDLGSDRDLALPFV